MRGLFAKSALLPKGWAEDIRFAITPAGDLAVGEPGTQGEAADETTERLSGTVLPGMPNIHSHAFQRAMAGLTERAGGGDDNFWSWREVMYGFVGKIGPEDLQAIAAQLYVEMLKAGYTSVAEFHYLHHDRDGTPYADRATLSEAIIAAATESGIGLTLLPVLYQTGGFDGRPLGEAQRRFFNATDDFVDLVFELARRHDDNPQIDFGVAFHSLRAISADTFKTLLPELDELAILAPRHIHVAEQTREVEECIAARGCRPVEWLLDNIGLDPSWCLVHATHLTPAETRRLAATGAIVALCPTTEANLGDGIFPLADFATGKGRWGIGSDSHVSVNPVEELRLLEYGQRLMLRERNIAARMIGGSGGRSEDGWRGGPGEESSGRVLWEAAALDGAIATGRDVGALAAGKRADLVVLDDSRPTLYGRRGDTLLDALVFAGSDKPIRDVMVGGKWVVRDGVHVREDEILARFKATIDRLM